MPMASPGPSLPGAFDILGAAGQDKLLYLKHKLKTVRLGCQGADLLHAMVLLKLGQETEARISLEALKADAVARLVARQWAGVDSTEAPEEPLDVSWAVARLYHLLAEEKLCPASMRDVAYQAALCALSSRDDHQLGELQDEARDRCGWDIIGDPGVFRPLHSNLDCFPPSSASPSGTRSLPRPIDNLSGWSHGHSLRSTGSPASLASNLEISQSPTMALSLHPRSHGPSKLCDEPLTSQVPGPVPPGRQEPEEMSWPPSVDLASSPEPPNSSALVLPDVAPGPTPAGLPDSPTAPETSTHYSVECTEVCAAPKSLPSPILQPIGNHCSVKDPTPPPQLSVEDTTSQHSKPHPPMPSEGPRTSPLPPSPSSPYSSHPASSSSCLSSPDVTSSEQKFYNFVVLHARADEHIALRVRERLEELGVPDGATFCEDFQVPGRGQLHCLQDAIEHSAFTILLLTCNFDCRLSRHQTSHTLMNSLTRHGWHDCVIPFLPLESSLAQLGSDVASLLGGLVWLDERSPIFARKVANTFKPQKLRARKATWRKEQDARTLRERSEHLHAEQQQAAAVSTAYSAYLQSYLSWQAQMESLQMAFGNHMSFGTQVPSGAQVPFGGQVPLGVPPSFPTWPGCPQPQLLHPWQTGIPPPAFPRPPASPQPPAFPTASLEPPQGPGLQPLIIHHAQMVQLGINNHMWNQRGAQAPEDKTQEWPSDQA